MDFNESSFRYCCYLEGSHDYGTQIRWEFKTKKYQYFTELMLQIFEEKYAYFPFRYSYWPEVTTILPELMRKFTKFNEKLRWDNDFELSQIANMDETPLLMNITNTKTIAKIGSKEFDIKTHRQEKIHVTAILWIIADGTKLPQMLVFKGQPDGRVERRLNKNWFVKDKKVFAYCQLKAWNNRTIMKKWINEVWRKYSYFVVKKETMLVMDDASLHKIVL